MDAFNASKEKTKILTEQLESEKLVVKQKDDLLANAGQRMKIAVAKAVTAFQTTEEYNTILFQWYFKGCYTISVVLQGFRTSQKVHD